MSFLSGYIRGCKSNSFMRTGTGLFSWQCELLLIFIKCNSRNVLQLCLGEKRQWVGLRSFLIVKFKKYNKKCIIFHIKRLEENVPKHYQWLPRGVISPCYSMSVNFPIFFFFFLQLAYSLRETVYFGVTHFVHVLCENSEK